MNTSNKILIVEDSKTFGIILKKRIEKELLFEPVLVSNYKEAEKLLRNEKSFFVALCDLHLPDAPNGEVIDLVIEKNIPIIVFTSNLNDDVREDILSKDIVDYVLKGDVRNVDYIIELIYRINKNRSVNVILVDDSSTSRKIITKLLKKYHFNVHSVSNGNDALSILENKKNIKLVITDYNMPEMGGEELIKIIRKRYPKEDLSIIGISAHGSGALSAKLLKLGCNDFLIKPFLNEEFYCRVTQNIEMLEYIETVRNAANKDYLTGLYNRRGFYEIGSKIYENALRGNIKINIAMIDIDHFKKTNDTYGHEIGDFILKNLSIILQDNIRKTDILARVGGEEFCIITVVNENYNSLTMFEKIRKKVENKIFQFDDLTLKITISTGITTVISDDIDESIKYADDMLYEAKKSGRNNVKIYTG